MRRIISNLSYSVLANLVTMLVSVFTVLLIPRYLGETAYGYYQLYLFYISYIGFFHLGWIDGIYLRIGGKQYDDLDRSLYSAQFWILTCIVTIIAVMIGTVCGFFVADIDKLWVLRMTCVCISLYLPVTYINYVFQATNLIKSFAQIVLSEKFIFIVLIVLTLVLNLDGFRWLIYADLIGKVCSLIIAAYYARKIIFCKMCNVTITAKEIWINISVGCKLMVANVASMLIIGIVRFAIENKWGVATFGKVSLSLSISNLVITFVLAVSVAIFPLLKQVDDQRRAEIYNLIRYILMPCLFFILLFYVPAQSILGMILPAYAESLSYLAIMLPVCIFECKMSLLINTYLKVMRKERQILFVNMCTVGISILTTVVTVFVFQSLEAAVFSIVLLVLVRAYLAEFYLSKVMQISILKDVIAECLLSGLFIWSSWFIGGIVSVAIYSIGYIAYMIFMKNKIKYSIKWLQKTVHGY